MSDPCPCVRCGAEHDTADMRRVTEDAWICEECLAEVEASEAYEA